jgi:hypothetical protein
MIHILYFVDKKKLLIGENLQMLIMNKWTAVLASSVPTRDQTRLPRIN